MRILKKKKKKKSKFLRETIFQRNTLILKMNEYLGATFYRFHVAEKPKLINTNSQTDQVTWIDLCNSKVKFYKERQLKL